MSLVELPTNTGKVFAVNPNHVTSVAPYRATMTGRPGMTDMSMVWVARDQGTNIYICAWSVEQTLDVLNTGRKVERDAFRAGYAAGVSADPSSVQHLHDTFDEYVGRSAPREAATSTQAGSG